MQLIKELKPEIYHQLCKKGISGDINKIAKTLGVVIELDDGDLYVKGDEEGLRNFEPHLDSYINQMDVSTVQRMIPRNLCGLIIGKKGQTIKNIAKISEAKLNLNNGTSILSITGNKEQITKAQNEIEMIMKQNFKMDIPEDKHGMIIGKGGKTIKNIAHVSGAKVSLKNGVLMISGEPQQIIKATEMVTQIINIGKIVLNPFEYDTLFGETNYLKELESKYKTKINVDLENYTLIIRAGQEIVDKIKTDISSQSTTEVVTDIFEDYETSDNGEEASEDDMFI